MHLIYTAKTVVPPTIPDVSFQYTDLPLTIDFADFTYSPMLYGETGFTYTASNLPPCGTILSATK